MRLGHARPATVTLMAGSVLLTGFSGVSLALAASTTVASAATTSGGESCQPLPPSAAPSSPSTSATPAPTAPTPAAPTATPPTPTATPTTADPSTTYPGPAKTSPDPTTTSPDPSTTYPGPATTTATASDTATHAATTSAKATTTAKATPTPTRTRKPSPATTPTKTPATKTPPTKSPTKKAAASTTPKPHPTASATQTRAIVRSSAKATPKATRTLKARPTPTASGTPTDTSSQNGAKTVPHATQVSLCVSVAGAHSSTQRGHAAQWTVSAWTTGGNVPDATIRLLATPASGGAPGFSGGCGNGDGTSACDLGPVDANSAPRQLQAQLTVPVTATTVKSLSLTVTGGAAHLTKDPQASATMSITAPPASTTAPPKPATPAPPKQAPPTQAPAPPAPAPPNPAVQDPAAQDPGAQSLANEPAPVTVTSPLPVGSLPGIPAVSPTVSPGGNAASLFPKLNPAPSKGLPQSSKKAHTRPVADTSALPEGDAVINAQLAGLAALAVAFVLAVTRLTIRRRPTPAKATTGTGQTPPPKQPEATANKPEVADNQAAGDQQDQQPDA